MRQVAAAFTAADFAPEFGAGLRMSEVGKENGPSESIR